MSSRAVKNFEISHLRGNGEAMPQIIDPNPGAQRLDRSRAPLPSLREEVRWYAAYTASCREKRVAEHLDIRQIERYLPLYRSPRKWKNGCRVELERPLFPGYVFVRMTAAARVAVLQVPGILSIVSRGREPQPFADDTIENLRSNLHLCNAEPHAYVVMGERVSICAGPFAGLSGIVVRNKGHLRVVITLDLIMKSMAVEVDSKDIEPVVRLAQIYEPRQEPAIR